MSSSFSSAQPKTILTATLDGQPVVTTTTTTTTTEQTTTTAADRATIVPEATSYTVEQGAVTYRGVGATTSASSKAVDYSFQQASPAVEYTTTTYSKPVTTTTTTEYATTGYKPATTTEYTTTSYKPATEYTTTTYKTSEQKAGSGIGMTTTTTEYGKAEEYRSTGERRVVQEYEMPENAYQAEVRKVSSVIINSTPLNPAPSSEEIRYVEVPTVEEQVSYVTVKETRTVDKIVKKPEIEWVTRTVEKIVPQIVEVPREVIKVQEVIVEKKIPQTVERQVEVIKEVKVPTKRLVEQTKEVPGPVIEREVPYPVEKKVEVIRHQDREVPVIIAQTVRPYITESNRHISVECLDYEPECIPIDVHVARPVQSTLEAVGQVDSKHRLVNITSGQYNTILKLLNQHMDEQTKATLPFVSENGRVPFIPDQEANFIVAPADVQVEGWNMASTTSRGIIPGTTTTTTGAAVGSGYGGHNIYQGQIVDESAFVSGTILPENAPASQRAIRGACCGGTGTKQTVVVETTSTHGTQSYTVEEQHVRSSHHGGTATQSQSHDQHHNSHHHHHHENQSAHSTTVRSTGLSYKGGLQPTSAKRSMCC